MQHRILRKRETLSSFSLFHHLINITSFISLQNLVVCWGWRNTFFFSFSSSWPSVWFSLCVCPLFFLFFCWELYEPYFYFSFVVGKDAFWKHPFTLFNSMSYEMKHFLSLLSPKTIIISLLRSTFLGALEMFELRSRFLAYSIIPFLDKILLSFAVFPEPYRHYSLCSSSCCIYLLMRTRYRQSVGITHFLVQVRACTG